MPPGTAGVAGFVSTLNVESIELKGAGGAKVLIHLSDGSSLVLHPETAARARLISGSAVDDALRESLLADSEKLFARGDALRLIARAAQTRRGLARKLAARGYGASAVRQALARMEELGYLDDRAFADAWLRSRVGGRPEGWKALYRGLVGRGVPRQVAEEALEAQLSPDEEIAAARRLARGVAPEAAGRKLAARGFRSRAIAAVLREARGRGHEERPQ